MTINNKFAKRFRKQQRKDTRSKQNKQKAHINECIGSKKSFNSQLQFQHQVPKKFFGIDAKDIILIFIGYIVGILLGMISNTPLIIIPLIMGIVLFWWFILKLLLKKIPSNFVFKLANIILLILVLSAVIFTFIQQSPYFLGSKRLRGLITGIKVPSSDFSWSTNGRVHAIRISEGGNIPIMKVELTLRSDKSCADAGWGMELIRWNWSKFIITYDASVSYKKGVSFYIRGEKGGENIGISMKSDRINPTSYEAESDEEKLPLNSIGITITKEWQKVIVPFKELPNFSRYKARNIAYYLNTTMMKSSSVSQVIYIKRIHFW